MFDKTSRSLRFDLNDTKPILHLTIDEENSNRAISIFHYLHGRSAIVVGLDIVSTKWCEINRELHPSREEY